MSRNAASPLFSLLKRLWFAPAPWPLFLIGLLLLGPISPDAQAGVYTDDLSKCLVKATSTNDRVVKPSIVKR